MRICTNEARFLMVDIKLIQSNWNLNIHYYDSISAQSMMNADIILENKVFSTFFTTAILTKINAIFYTINLSCVVEEITGSYSSSKFYEGWIFITRCAFFGASATSKFFAVLINVTFITNTFIILKIKIRLTESTLSLKIFFITVRNIL